MRSYEFVGEAADDFSGISVSSAGDVDGDGKEDLLIGANRADDGGGTDSGSTYLINANDLATLDAADGTIDGVISLAQIEVQATLGTVTSYEFVGEDGGDRSGTSVSSAGDVDGDGNDDLLIGAFFADGGGGTDSGSTYLINASDLATLDAADGTVDGVIDLGRIEAHATLGTVTSYEFVGEGGSDYSGWSVSSAGDVDNDGNDDLLIGAVIADDGGGTSSGSTYLINADDLATLDAADGTVDGVISLGQIEAQATLGTVTSYEFVGEDAFDQSGTSVSSAGDVDGDGNDDLLIGARFADDGGGSESGSTYLINADDLATLDAADGTTDGVIFLGQVEAQATLGMVTSYEFVGAEADDYSGGSVSSAGDVDGDGKEDLLIGASFSDGDGGSTYLINADDLATLDAADGTTDGVIDLGQVEAQATLGTVTSYEFVGEDAGDRSGVSVSSAGDVDGDGNDDLLIGAFFADDGGGTWSGSTYLINADDLATLDAADATVDGIIDLGQIEAQATLGTVTSYEFVGENGDDRSGLSVSSADDVDGDGNDDLLIGAHRSDAGGTDAGSTYLILASDLATLDAADGTVDGVIDLSNVECFAAGTGIATPTGERAVESLAIGDTVLTADGRSVPVTWIGRRSFWPALRGDRFDLVRIRAGALGDDLPHSDLTVTTDHGMILGDLVVNAGALINGVTITAVPAADLPGQVTVYHVETEAHDVILANGAASETFIDYTGRQGFDNYADYLALNGTSRIIPEMPRPRIAAARLLPAALCARLTPPRAA